MRRLGRVVTRRLREMLHERRYVYDLDFGKCSNDKT